MKKIIMKYAKFFHGLLLVFILLIVGIFLFELNKSDNANNPIKKTTEIILSSPRRDFVDPGPIQEECQRILANYINEVDFKNKGFSECKLIESKVGHTDKECPNGFSPEGCSICKLECN